MTIHFIRLCFVFLGGLLLSVSSPLNVSAEPTKTRIGVIAPLSGPLAEYGIASRNGIEMARKESPELFQNIEFLFEDSQWDAKSSVSAFNRLRTVDKVDLVYNWGNPTTEAIAPLAEQYHLPLIALTLDPKVSLGKDYVIRTTNDAAAFSKGLARQLERTGARRVGIVITENSYLRGLASGLKQQLGSNQEMEIIDAYNISDHDFRTTVSKIRAKSYDAVGVFLISGQVSEFYRQMKDQGLNIQTFGTDFFESSTEIGLAEGAMNGAFYTHLGTTPEFRKDYVDTYGNDYQIAYAGNAYDMAILLGNIFRNHASIPSSDEIMTLLKNPGEHQGVGGRFHYADTPDSGPHFEFPIQVKLIREGSIVSSAD